MRKTLVAATLVAGALLGLAAPAMADVSVVDKPDTSNLNNIWTFDPLGVPVFGLVQSISQALTRLY
jgi:hypothetical protein